MTTTRPDTGTAAPATAGRAAAARVGAGIFISRVLGFVRERVFAHYFGSSEFADAWRAALRLPNVLRNLLGEGTLSASMIPVYAELVEQGRTEDARRFAGAVFGILTAVAAVVVAIGMLLAPVFVALFFPLWDAGKQEITALLVRILFPMVGIFVVSAWAMGVLDSHRRFFVSYVAPAFWNVALITTMVAGGVYWGLGARDLVLALALGAVVGAGLQLAVQLPVALRNLGGLRPSLGRGVEGVREAIDNYVPVVTARGVINLSGWLEMILAGLLAEGALAVIGYAQTFYLLPISLFGISIAASELPELSRMREEDRAVLAARVSVALRRVSYFLVPSLLGYVALGDVVIAGLYETGAFGTEQTLATWSVLAAYALGLPASASSRALSSAFYALRDTRTPARIAYLRVAASLAVGVSLMFPFEGLAVAELRLGAVGLALGASVAAWIEYGLLRRRLGERVGPHGPGVGPTLRFGLAATVAAGLAVGLQLALPPLGPEVLAVATLVPFAAVYLGVTAALGHAPRRR